MIVCMAARYPVFVVILFVADVCSAAHRSPFQHTWGLVMTLLRRTSRIAYKEESKTRKRVLFYR